MRIFIVLARLKQLAFQEKNPTNIPKYSRFIQPVQENQEKPL